MVSAFHLPPGSYHELDEPAITQSPPPDHATTSSHPLTNDTEKATHNLDAAPDGGLRAWMVAAGAATIFFCTLGLSNTFGLFEAYYLTHQLQGQTESTISWIGSVQSFLQFFSGMLAGPLFDRYGVWVGSLFPQRQLFNYLQSLTQLPGHLPLLRPLRFLPHDALPML